MSKQACFYNVSIYNVLDILPEESLLELRLMAVELLKKAGLTELNEKLQAL